MEKSPTFLRGVRCVCKNIKITITLKLHIGRNCIKTLQFNLFDGVRSFITSVTLIKARVVCKFLNQNSRIILYW